MIKTGNIKKALLQVTFATAILLIASCNTNPKQGDTNDNAEQKNEAILENNTRENDAQFLVSAAEIALEEIQLGKLAQQNSKTSHVKEMGKMMEDEHTKSLSDLTALAKSKMIPIPTSPTGNSQNAFEILNTKSGNEFDKAFADMLVNGHKYAISTFENASTEANDAAIKYWASASLPGLRTHLSHSIECQRKCDKM